jgi:NAD(P)H-nitrite reductase large subunit
MILIEIKNAMQLARRRSFLARTVGALMPEVVARRVDEEVARLIREALAERGVEAEIELR